MVTPSTPSALCHTPVSKIIRAVHVHTIKVSTTGPTIATIPSLIGSCVLAAPCAIDSVPIPASLEKAPRRTPIKITAPTEPPATASPVKASVTISRRVAGISAAKV